MPTKKTHDYECPACGFTSSGWPTAELRDKRGAQHAYEHAEGVPMSELVDFENKEG